MTLSSDELSRVADGNVVDASGDKLGGIGQIYADDDTGEPTWVTVKTGLFGTSESFVPLTGASVSGSDLVVDYGKDTIKEAPRVDADGHLSPEEEETLFAYYGLGGNTSAARDDRDADRTTTTAPVADRDDDRVGDSARRAGYDDSRDHDDAAFSRDDSDTTTDDAMTLSEEQLRVGTQTQEVGRARLRKYVVTEHVTQTVPVTREEVRIEREPITEANRSEAVSGPAIIEDEHEVVLHEERPVVEKEAVPVERVRLETDTVTEQASVNEDVRKEQIDTDLAETSTSTSDRTDDRTADRTTGRTTDR